MTIVGMDDLAEVSLSSQVTISGPVRNRWKMDEGSGGTIADSGGTEDGTINGPTWVSGTYQGGYALDADGTDDYVDVGVTSFGNDLDTDFAIGVTFETTASLNTILSTRNDNAGTQLSVKMDWANAGPGELAVGTRDEGSDWNLTWIDGTTYDDGNKYRLLWNKISNDSSNWEMWINNVSQSVSVQLNETVDNPTTFDYNIPFFLDNDNGTFVDYMDGRLDDIIIYSDSLTTQEISDDYNAQPWA